MTLIEQHIVKKLLSGESEVQIKESLKESFGLSAEDSKEKFLWTAGKVLSWALLSDLGVVIDPCLHQSTRTDQETVVCNVCGERLAESPAK